MGYKTISLNSYVRLSRLYDVIENYAIKNGISWNYRASSLIDELQISRLIEKLL
jgi:hypothetical protein